MSGQPPSVPTPVFFPPIWPGLPSELQQRAVRLLAQLAYTQFRQQLSQATQEINHGYFFSQQSQGSSRSS
jgi:hypothetical protein